MTMPLRLPVAKRVLMLGQNVLTLGEDYVMNFIHNGQALKANAFIVSAVIQVISRIIRANISAKEAANTPDALYRWLESVKTTFREAAAVILSYGVLRSAQGFVTDYFRHGLEVTRGLGSKKPSWLWNKVFRWHFRTDTEAMDPRLIKFPNLKESVVGLWNEVKDALTGNQARRMLTPIQAFYEKDSFYGIHFNEANPTRMAFFQKWEKPLINKVYELVRPIQNRFSTSKLPELAAVARATKLKVFFDWFPIGVGMALAIPLSGLALERFCQNYSDKLAAKIASFLGKNEKPALAKANPNEANPPQPITATPVASPAMLGYGGQVSTMPYAGSVYAVPYAPPPVLPALRLGGAYLPRI